MSDDNSIIKYGYLRMLEYRDLDLVLQWRNTDRIRKNMFSDHIISVDEHYQWFSSLDKKKTGI